MSAIGPRAKLREALLAAARAAAARGSATLRVRFPWPGGPGGDEPACGLARECGSGTPFRSDPDPRSGPDFFWEDPTEGRALAAWGRAWEVTAEGPDRFEQSARAVERRLGLLHDVDLGRPPSQGAVLVGGFAFGDRAPAAEWEGMPAAGWWLPEVLVQTERGRGWVAVAAARGGNEPPERWAARLAERLEAWEGSGRKRSAGAPGPPASAKPSEGATRRAQPPLRLASDVEARAYRARVSSALAAIRAGELEKVVVARAIEAEAARPVDPAAAVARLRRTQPGARLFALRRGGGVFLGATPERLLLIAGERIVADALAGSAPRGRDAREDARLARALRENKKEREEHALVVRALHGGLAPLCERLEVGESLAVAAFADIQHLRTRLEGRLRPGVRVALIEAARRLHPSPAVAGTPRAAALRWIERHEDLERGWYAGLVGWLDERGGGELDVALRCALVRGRRVRLFAGAGVVAGSTPAHELAETELKARAAWSALVEGQP